MIDSRYTYVGDLPTGYSPYNITKIYLRELSAREAVLAKTGTLQSAVDTLKNILLADGDFNVEELTDGDFEFLIVISKIVSFPEAPMVAKWECKNMVLRDANGNIIITDKKLTDPEIELKEIKREVCGTENNTLVYNVKKEILALDDGDTVIPYDDLDFPRINTKLQFEQYNGDKKIAELSRWIKKGNTLEEKIEILNSSDLDLYERILEVKDKYNHGVLETFSVFCRVCDDRHTHTVRVNVDNYLAVVSEKDVMDIQYSFLNAFNSYLDDSVSIKKLLYFNSCLIKDKKEERERNKLKRNSR